MYIYLVNLYKKYLYFTLQFFFGFELLCMRFFFDSPLGFLLFSTVFFYGAFDNSGSLTEMLAFVLFTYQMGMCSLFCLIFSVPFSRKYALLIFENVPVILTGNLSARTFLWRLLKCWALLFLAMYLELHTAGLNFVQDMTQANSLKDYMFLESTGPEERRQAFEEALNLYTNAPARKGIISSTLHHIKNFLHK